MVNHIFKSTARFKGGYNGEGTIENKHLKYKISIPAEMNGPDIGTNPDEMLMSAAVTCFTITLSSYFEKNNLPVEVNHVDATATISVNKGIQIYESITYVVYLERTADNESIDMKILKRIIDKAENNCMITKALKGNVEVSIESIYLDEQYIFHEDTI
ncbi:OsmC family protein [Macrococcus capreoli]|uniref:OsmC family protein n=1 Tax=Macrococcus capreoli TaxID=2982690 RepID=UPI0021D5DD2E|nr:OsmC family protein [Macrococcus sp. TMW 2.2395]MCU7558282.1 OsmC family protein [Macrococcus sp. TMW 2.2395]